MSAVSLFSLGKTSEIPGDHWLDICCVMAVIISLPEPPKAFLLGSPSLLNWDSAHSRRATEDNPSWVLSVLLEFGPYGWLLRNAPVIQLVRAL